MPIKQAIKSIRKMIGCVIHTAASLETIQTKPSMRKLIYSGSYPNPIPLRFMRMFEAEFLKKNAYSYLNKFIA